jgi:hypothetical protein
VELAAVRAWSRTKASAWPGLRLTGGTVVDGLGSPGFVDDVTASGLAGSTMVFRGTGMSFVAGAVVGVTVVGAAVVAGTVVGGTVVVGWAPTVVVVAAGPTWARPAVELPKRDRATAVAARRGVRVLFRT